MSKVKTSGWEFTRRFRCGAFGWKSQPAIERGRQAVNEIKRVALRDPALAAEGAVPFLERVSPALEHVDSSSGEIGNAVNHAIKDLVRAARDFADRRPEFAVEAGLAALRWLVEGRGYETTGAEVWAAYANTMRAAEKAGRTEELRHRIRVLVARKTHGERFVTRMFGRELGL